MHFAPPVIKHIDEVLPYIKDNPAFIVADKGWYKVIDYVYAHRDTFDNDYARECRGLKFDAKTGDIIARPYHKFHNLGECAGYHTSDINLNEPHVVLDKLDGSMVHTCLNKDTNEYFLMTRMGYTDVGQMAMRFAINNPEVDLTIANLIREYPTKTFIFEYVGPNNRIVIPYKEEALILTGIRDIYTGTYQTMMGMKAYLARYSDIPIVQPYADILSPAEIAMDEQKEGAVVRFDTGAMVKIKSDIYVRKHKSKELTESFKGVVQLVVDGTLDDILPQVEPGMEEALLDYEASLLTRLQTLHEGIRHNLSLRKEMDQKTFALNIQAQFPKQMQKLLFMTRKSGDGYAELIKLIKSRYNKETDLHDLFEELEIPVWQ